MHKVHLSFFFLFFLSFFLCSFFLSFLPSCFFVCLLTAGPLCRNHSMNTNPLASFAHLMTVSLSACDLQAETLPIFFLKLYKQKHFKERTETFPKNNNNKTTTTRNTTNRNSRNTTTSGKEQKHTRKKTPRYKRKDFGKYRNTTNKKKNLPEKQKHYKQ